MLFLKKAGQDERVQLHFITLDKRCDLSFLARDPDAIYLVDISAIRTGLPAYRKHLDHQLEHHAKLHILNYDFYGQWLVIGPNYLRPDFPRLELIY